MEKKAKAAGIEPPTKGHLIKKTPDWTKWRNSFNRLGLGLGLGDATKSVDDAMRHPTTEQLIKRAQNAGIKPPTKVGKKKPDWKQWIENEGGEVAALSIVREKEYEANRALDDDLDSLRRDALASSRDRGREEGNWI